MQASKNKSKPEDWNFDANSVIGAVLDKVTASQVDKTKESVPAAPVPASKEDAPESKPEVWAAAPFSFLSVASWTASLGAA